MFVCVWLLVVPAGSAYVLNQLHVDRNLESPSLTSRSSKMVVYTLSRAWHTATKEISCRSKALVKQKLISCTKQVHAEPLGVDAKHAVTGLV